MTRQMKRVLAMLALLLIALPAWSMTLEQAKSSGAVGEQLNGYLGIVTSSPSAELRALVNEINTKRKAHYQSSAESASVTLEIFEQRMGQRLHERAAPGEYIQDANGQWRKK